MARRGVKQFTTWDYDHKGVTVKVPVELVDTAKTAGSSYGGGNDAKTYFAVHMSEPEINEQHTDINELRKKVFAILKDQLTIDWRNVLVVTVKGSRERLFDKRKRPDTPDTEREADASLSISWERWQIAELKRKKISRSFSNYYTPHSWGGAKAGPSREVWNSAIERWPIKELEEEVKFRGRRRGRRLQPNDVMAMIPDTAENRLALEAIADQMEMLRARLAAIMTADKIETTLKHVASTGLALLPSPNGSAAD